MRCSNSFRFRLERGVMRWAMAVSGWNTHRPIPWSSKFVGLRSLKTNGFENYFHVVAGGQTPRPSRLRSKLSDQIQLRFQPARTRRLFAQRHLEFVRQRAFGGKIEARDAQGGRMQEQPFVPRAPRKLAVEHEITIGSVADDRQTPRAALHAQLVRSPRHRFQLQQ